MLRSKQIRDLSTLGRNRLRADLRRSTLGDTIKHFGELVARVLTDVLGDVRVVVVESLRGTESLDKGEIAWAASCNDLAARKNRELDCQTTRRGAAAINE